MNEWSRPVRCALVISLLLVGGLRLPASPASGASDLDELEVKREGPFEFARKPVVTRSGDRVTIEFEAKGFCDATVAVEDADSRIIRHLAGGLLGPNAPEPFQKNSKKQVIIWDGKNEKGEYVDDKEALTVRVSLGLKARFERTLFWSPEKRASSQKYAERLSPAVAAAPEGVYLHETAEAGDDFLRLFDHDGRYLRTLYPFPGKTLTEVQGLKWQAFPPDGRRFALKTNPAQTTWLTTGGGLVLAVRGSRIALAGVRLNRLATDSTTGGLALTGPDVTRPVYIPGVHTFRSGTYPISPRDGALSLDGKWLYLTNYRWGNAWNEGILPGVGRLAMTGDEATLETFTGSLEKGGDGGPARLQTPASVDCDNQGRVYVADFTGDRVHVFTPAGDLIKSIPVERPAWVRVHQKTGEIYVFTWDLAGSYSGAFRYGGPPKLTRFGPLDNPEQTGAWPLQMSSRYGAKWVLYRGEVDSWTDPPTVWIADAYPRVYEVRGRELVLKKGFREEAQRQVVKEWGPRHGRQRLYFNPGDGYLYVGEHHDPNPIHVKGFTSLIRIDPATGNVHIVPLPFDAEDMAFGMDGLAYLRTLDMVARYDPATWREVPFDYGQEVGRMSYQGLKPAHVSSALFAPAGGNSSSQMGGMHVSPKGHVVVTFYSPGGAEDRRSEKGVLSSVDGSRKTYAPVVFPGRAVTCLVHVWNEHGRLLREDVVPGVGRTGAVAMGQDDNLYLLTDSEALDGGQPHPNHIACALVKVKPGTKVLCGGGRLPVPLGQDLRPDRSPDLPAWHGAGSRVWIEGREWIYPGVGIEGKFGAPKCHCAATSQMVLDYFARTFVGEIQRCDVVVIDSAGNTILRIGQYGNIDEGMPLVKAGGPPAPRPIGGDEVSLVNPKFVAVDTDRRLFVADMGNYRILSIKLDYHSTERTALKDVKDRL